MIAYDNGFSWNSWASVEADDLLVSFAPSEVSWFETLGCCFSRKNNDLSSHCCSSCFSLKHNVKEDTAQILTCSLYEAVLYEATPLPGQ